MASRHAAAVLGALRHVAPIEALVQSTVVKHLAARAVPGLVFFAVPNGGSRQRIEAARMVGQGVVAGVPDIVLIHTGRCYGLELKRAKGGRVSPVQKEFHERWVAAGGIFAVASGLDEALDVLTRWQLLRGSSAR